jgi:hypothetical protein
MTNDAVTSKYLGTWLLVPELCIYQQGDPPSRGVYTIAQSGDEVEISIAWTARDGTSHEISFRAPDDGTRRPVAGDASSELSIRRIDDLILDSSVYSGDRVLAYARRCASSDGRLLSTVQEGSRAGGTSYRNFQVYRRKA